MSIVLKMSYQGDCAYQGTQVSSLDLTFAQTQTKIHAVIAKKLTPDEQPLKFLMAGNSMDGSDWIKISNLANAKTIALWANIFSTALSSASCQNQSNDKEPQKDPDNERIPVAITELPDFKPGKCYHVKVIHRGDALTASFSLVEGPIPTDRADRERQFEEERLEGLKQFFQMKKGLMPAELLAAIKPVGVSQNSDDS